METMPRTYFSGQLLLISFYGYASPGNETGSILRPKPICAQFLKIPIKVRKKALKSQDFRAIMEG